MDKAHTYSLLSEPSFRRLLFLIIVFENSFVGRSYTVLNVICQEKFLCLPRYWDWQVCVWGGRERSSRPPHTIPSVWRAQENFVGGFFFQRVTHIIPPPKIQQGRKIRLYVKNQV
jgi:hypothetical protein